MKNPTSSGRENAFHFANKKDPHKFEEVVEAYLFETIFVDKIKLQTESGEKEIPKKFS